MTIVVHSFDGVWHRFFLKPETIKYVIRPTRQSYSSGCILWMGWITKEEGIFIHYDENHGERRMSFLKWTEYVT